MSEASSFIDSERSNDISSEEINVIATPGAYLRGARTVDAIHRRDSEARSRIHPAENKV